MIQKKMKILVVDDDPNLVQIITEYIINIYKHDARGAQLYTEEELIKQLDNEDYDVLLLNIMMPGDGGLELTRRIRSRGLNLPIILTTGYNIPIRALEAMRSGADDLIIKPFLMKELMLSILKVLKQRSMSMNNIRYQSTVKTESVNFDGLGREYYKTGELMAEIGYKNGKIDGIYKVYRKCGTLLAEANFRNGIVDGPAKWFNYQGILTIT